MKVIETNFALLTSGEKVKKYTLSNGTMEVDILNFGGIITSIRTPDKTGRLADVVLGFDTLAEYENNPQFLGCIIGRYANRIANGKFFLGDTAYSLNKNNGPNSLHGGINQPFHKVLWNSEAFERPETGGVILTHTSKAMTDGFPGTLKVTVTYSLNQKNELRIDYMAITDEKTVINLTNHSYFNLSGRNSNILDHQLLINADTYLPVDETSIPYGPAEKVKGSPFDFSTLRPIGERIEAEDDQLKKGNGYDHNWILNGEGLKTAAILYEPESGRRMETLTTEPGLQFYSANWLTGPGKNGETYFKRGAVCLETQHFPDSPNKPEYPSTLLEPGQEYNSVTIYRFNTGDSPSV